MVREGFRETRQCDTGAAAEGEEEADVCLLLCSVWWMTGDQMRLQNASGTAARDIVQFVSMREFVTPTGIDRAGFSRALLEELPAQVRRNATAASTICVADAGSHVLTASHMFWWWCWRQMTSYFAMHQIPPNAPTNLPPPPPRSTR